MRYSRMFIGRERAFGDVTHVLHPLHLVLASLPIEGGAGNFHQPMQRPRVGGAEASFHRLNNSFTKNGVHSAIPRDALISQGLGACGLLADRFNPQGFSPQFPRQAWGGSDN
jgi:hypothetical protein